jgi:Leucine-rich repeat (LRR) protein
VVDVIYINEDNMSIEGVKRWLKTMESFKLGVVLLQKQFKESTYIGDVELRDLLIETKAKKAICFEEGLLYVFQQNRKLNLNHMGIEEIPSNINCLCYLRRLNLSGNKIKEIPSDLSKMSNLEYLDLNNNSIEELPKGLKLPPSIKSVNLYSNAFEKSMPNIDKYEKVIRLNNNFY